MPSNLDTQLLRVIESKKTEDETERLMRDIFDKDAKHHKDAKRDPDIYRPSEGLNRQWQEQRELPANAQCNVRLIYQMDLPAIAALNTDHTNTALCLKKIRWLVERGGYSADQALWVAVERSAASLKSILTYLLIVGANVDYRSSEGSKRTQEIALSYEYSPYNFVTPTFKAHLAVCEIVRLFPGYKQQLASRRTDQTDFHAACLIQFAKACEHDANYVFQYIALKLELHAVKPADIDFLQFLTKKYLYQIKGDIKHNEHRAILVSLWEKVEIKEDQLFGNRDKFFQSISKGDGIVLGSNQFAALQGETAEVKRGAPPAPLADSVKAAERSSPVHAAKALDSASSSKLPEQLAVASVPAARPA